MFSSIVHYMFRYKITMASMLRFALKGDTDDEALSFRFQHARIPPV